MSVLWLLGSMLLVLLAVYLTTTQPWIRTPRYGLIIQGSSNRIYGNTINDSGGCGYGIYVEGGEWTIKDCRIHA